MTTEDILQLLTGLHQREDLQMLVMRFHSGANVLRYAGNHIAFSRYSDLSDFAKEMVNWCVGGETPRLKADCALRQYNGQHLENRFSEIDSSNALVSVSWRTFLEALRDASREGNPLAQTPNAVVLTSATRDFSLISIQHPVLNFKQRRIFFGKRSFRRIGESDQILSLSTNADIVVMRNKIVFLSEKGVPFFITESAIKRVALQKAEQISSCNWISTPEKITELANVPRYATWLLAVDDNRLAKLDASAVRKRIAEVFNLRYAQGKFSTAGKADAVALIKILSKRGMLDVVEGVPVEVSGADTWKKE